jgi:hypothetical protein
MSQFKLPISYNNNKILLNETIITDLELIKTIDKPEENRSIYDYAFNPTTKFGKDLLKEYPQYYSTDIEFLKDTQQLLKTYKNKESVHDFTNVMSIWEEIKNDTGFKEKYQYIEFDYFKHLNNSSHFLQIMSMYNLSSPVISVFVPIFLLIIPFFIIQLRGLQISISQYIEVLKQIAANHAIGKLFTNFNQVDNNQKVYLLISTGFYFFSIYQNIMACYQFHNNMIKMHTYLEHIKNYINYTCESMSNLLSYTTCLNTYSNFNNDLQSNINSLREFNNDLISIIPYKLTPYTIGGLGHVLKCFYQLYDNAICKNALIYSFGFNGYIDNMNGLIKNITDKYIQFATFTNKDKKENSKRDSKGKKSKSKMKNSYYPVLMHETPVKNDCDLKNIIITGPNASGKTTTLKSILINVIISQQFGCGFYESASFSPFDYIHCYLNIPDTSGRDSLFQAECRRCKEILDTIKENELSKTHLCVFDELYSGTNPDEAVMSSLAFMKYLIKSKNITCILTTHFIKVCNKLDNLKTITNYCMETHDLSDQKNGLDFKYTYKLKKGISTIKGGIKVLRDMNYPEEILNDMG